MNSTAGRCGPQMGADLPTVCDEVDSSGEQVLGD